MSDIEEGYGATYRRNWEAMKKVENQYTPEKRRLFRKEAFARMSTKPEGAADLENLARDLGEQMRKWFRDYSGIWYNAPRPNEEIEAIALTALQRAVARHPIEVYVERVKQAEQERDRLTAQLAEKEKERLSAEDAVISMRGHLSEAYDQRDEARAQLATARQRAKVAGEQCDQAQDLAEDYKRQLAAAKEDTRRLDGLIHWLGFNDCDIPIRDWEDDQDARAAIDAFLKDESSKC